MSEKTKLIAGMVGATTAAAVVGCRTVFPGMTADLKTARLLNGRRQMIMDGLMSGKLIIDVFEEHVAKTPNKACVIYEDRIYTYEFINNMANKVANLVSTWNLNPNDTVATMISNEPAFVWTFFGLLKLGLADACINYHLTARLLAHSIKASEGKAIIVGTGEPLFDALFEILDDLPDIPIYVYEKRQTDLPDGMLSMDDALLQTLPINVCTAVRNHVTLKSPMCFIYTSGTTGLPKPAIINQAKAIGTSYSFQVFNFTTDDIVYIVTPLYHSGALLLSFFNSIRKGATMVIRNKFSASHFFEDVRRHDITVIQYIGELCRYIISLPKSPLDGVHKVRVAYGNGLRQDIWEEFKKRFRIPWIIEFFGATEATGSSVNLVNKAGACGRLSPLMKWLTVGRAPPTQALIAYDPIEDRPIRNKEGHCVNIKPGEQGLFITVITPSYSGFYKGTADMNEKKILRNVFTDGDAFFSYGDLIYLDKEYSMYFRDRVGDTFRWKGENVSTREVCDVISSLNFIQDVNVYGVKIEGTEGRAGMAAITLQGETEVTEDHLKNIYKKCSHDLPSYARPLFLRFQKSFIVTETMKHRKVELVSEGFDPRKISDPLFVINNDKKTYTPLTVDTTSQVLLSRL